MLKKSATVPSFEKRGREKSATVLSFEKQGQEKAATVLSFEKQGREKAATVLSFEKRGRERTATVLSFENQGRRGFIYISKATNSLTNCLLKYIIDAKKSRISSYSFFILIISLLLLMLRALPLNNDIFFDKNDIGLLRHHLHQSFVVFLLFQVML